MARFAIRLPGAGSEMAGPAMTNAVGAPPELEVTARSIALTALDIALAYWRAGTREEGGNNRGHQVEFFQRLMGGAPGDPWCADFVCACLVKAYARRHGSDESRTFLPGYVHAASAALLPLSGYCPALAEAARQRYRFRSREFRAAPGDLVLFDFDGVGEPHHVGFVVERRPDGTLRTVEGNTSSGEAGSQADGDGVFPRVRGCGRVFGYIHWF